MRLNAVLGQGGLNLAFDLNEDDVKVMLVDGVDEVDVVVGVNVVDVGCEVDTSEVEDDWWYMCFSTHSNNWCLSLTCAANRCMSVSTCGSA